jgi:hypothetical protein
MNNRRPPPVLSNSEQPALTIDPQHLNFGEVWETDRFEWRLCIENRSQAPLAITGLGGSCTCLSLEPQQFTIEPGQQQRVHAVLNLHSRAAQSESQPHEDFVAAFWAHVRGQEKPVYWQLHGRIRRSLQTVDRLDLGSVSYRSPAAAAQRFPVRILSGTIGTLEAEPGSAAIRTELQSNPNGRDFAVTIVPAQGLGKAKLNSTVILTPISHSGERFPSVRVPVTFEVGEEVQATPQFIQFGGREVGQEASEVITLRSVGGHNFRVRGFRTEGGGLSAHRIEQGDATVYEVVRRFTAPGSFEGRVIFDVVLGDGESFEVPVPVRGFGSRNP